MASKGNKKTKSSADLNADAAASPAPASPAPAPAAAPATAPSNFKAGELSLKEAFDSPPVTTQLAGRKSAIADLDAAVKDAVAKLEARVVPDNSFARSEMDGQLDATFPELGRANIATEEQPAVYDFANLQKKIADLKERQNSADAPYKPAFGAVIKRAEEILKAFTGTTVFNRSSEEAVIRAIDDIVRLIDQFIALSFPEIEALHNASLDAADAADHFEEKRFNLDWSRDMITEEADLYSRIDQIIIDETKMFEEAMRSREEVANFSASAVPPIDTAAAKESLTNLEKQRRVLKDKESGEKGHFTRLESRLQSDIRSAQNDVKTQDAAVTRLSEQLRELSTKLAAAQNDLFIAQKKEAVYTSALDALRSKYSTDAQSEAAQIAVVDAKTADANSTLKAAAILTDLGKEVGSAVAEVKRAREAQYGESLFHLCADRMVLDTKVYYKTALASFACDARVQMKLQQREAVLVKKKRSNAAQDTDGVAECNQSLADIDRQIQAEKDRKVELQEVMKRTDEAFIDIGKAIGTLTIPAELRNDVPAIRSSWDAMRRRLVEIEKEQANKIVLEDVLDAGFLNKSLEM